MGKIWKQNLQNLIINRVWEKERSVRDDSQISRLDRKTYDLLSEIFSSEEILRLESTKVENRGQEHLQKSLFQVSDKS